MTPDDVREAQIERGVELYLDGTLTVEALERWVWGALTDNPDRDQRRMTWDLPYARAVASVLGNELRTDLTRVAG